MFTISGNGIIQLNRGDSVSMPLFINKGTNMRPIRYKISENPSTKVYFGVMEPNQPFENALIRKTFSSESKINSNGDLIIELASYETENILPGKYYYQVKVLFEDGNVSTVIPKTLFYIVD